MGNHHVFRQGYACNMVQNATRFSFTVLKIQKYHFSCSTTLLDKVFLNILLKRFNYFLTICLFFYGIWECMEFVSSKIIWFLCAQYGLLMPYRKLGVNCLLSGALKKPLALESQNKLSEEYRKLVNNNNGGKH